jgi:hypothetical protein
MKQYINVCLAIITVFNGNNPYSFKQTDILNQKESPVLSITGRYKKPVHFSYFLILLLLLPEVVWKKEVVWR